MKPRPASGLSTIPGDPGPRVRPRIASTTAKSSSSGSPILAAASMPLATPRERIQTLSARVRTKKNIASPGSAKSDPACWPR